MYVYVLIDCDFKSNYALIQFIQLIQLKQIELQIHSEYIYMFIECNFHITKSYNNGIR